MSLIQMFIIGTVRGAAQSSATGNATEEVS